MELEKARVRWFLSLDSNDLPAGIAARGQRTYRSVKIEEEEMEFSGGFTDLHTETYRDILAGKGYGLADARHSVEIAHKIRNTLPDAMYGEIHPLVKKLL
jgi:UDP-N-acetyl-2-amino-2-deoxyglucuronate dehydrogenase